MESQEEQDLDGSSIKPVSSLRSHFEQMANSSPKKTAPPPRPISPKPKTYVSNVIIGDSAAVGSATENYLQPAVSNNNANSSLSPGPVQHKSMSTEHVAFPPISPAVIIEPPSSPPRTLNLNLTLLGSSAFLTAEGLSSKSGTSSPRHFKIPSRPSTPISEPRKTSAMPVMQPPEPPPPRRSAELRRNPTPNPSMGPPPVNRAEKPRMSASQTLRPSTKELVSENLQPCNDRASPFSTPPSSESSPRLDPIPRSPSRPGSVVSQPYAISLTTSQMFDPPPIHHSLASLKKDVDAYGQGRIVTAIPATSDHRDQRPTLPVRPFLDSSLIVPARISLDNHRQSKISSVPIDTLRSFSNGISIPKTSNSELSHSVPPKRNFSTPVSQLQTTPRIHGRSMTVDQIGSRVPLEFRTAENSIPSIEHSERAVTPKLSTVDMATSSSAIDYPNPSLSNRRPPHIKQGVTEVFTKFDARIFDICGQYICASGHQTRVWSVHDGEQVVNLSHGESIKVLSLAFKPASDPDNEGERLWLGNNFGELIELKITSQNPIIATNSTAHNRREILKIYRHKNDMWTLDESGTLHVWPSNTSGPPNLENQSTTYRVPKGHTYSLVVNDELWYATGSDIRIFMPTVEGRSQFQLLQRPLSQPGLGEITSGIMMDHQPDKVYFGHSDGKVSIYSTENYDCLGTVNVSIYKINSLTCSGPYLWAAYSTGMIYIYDTRETPWVIKKDWRAHVNPVINVSADRSSFWKIGQPQVVSLGADNSLKFWDGLLEEDWLEAEFQQQDNRYCKLEQIKALVMTWNAGASTPHSLRYTETDKNFLPDLLKESQLPDILVFNFQELVDLEDKKTTAKSLFSKPKKKDSSEPEHMSHQYRDWRDYLIRCLDDEMPRGELYHLLSSNSLVGLFTCVFIRARLRDRIKGVSGAEVKRGLGGRAGNKGALILRFLVDDTSLCFINCHLAAGQTQTKDRNFDVSSILDSTILPIEEHQSVRLNSYVGGGDGTMILDHEICILSGDLNYRIDAMSRDAVINTLNARNLNKLLERDQLLASKRKRPGFRLRAFYEMPITFAPTYKYDIGSDHYDTSEKKRTPAWCDRILSRGRDQDRLKQLDYRRHEVRVSDHRPVTGLFQITVKSISSQQRAMVWAECKRRFEDFKQKRSDSAKLDFLMNVCDLDGERCRELLDGNQNFL